MQLVHHHSFSGNQIKVFNLENVQHAPEKLTAGPFTWQVKRKKSFQVLGFLVSILVFLGVHFKIELYPFPFLSNHFGGPHFLQSVKISSTSRNYPPPPFWKPLALRNLLDKNRLDHQGNWWNSEETLKIWGKIHEKNMSKTSAWN